MKTPLQIAREKRQITQPALAEALGIHQSYYSRVERGQKRCTPVLAQKISSYFGHSVSEMEILYPERYARPEDAL